MVFVDIESCREIMAIVSHLLLLIGPTVESVRYYKAPPNDYQAKASPAELNHGQSLAYLKGLDFCNYEHLVNSVLGMYDLVITWNYFRRDDNFGNRTRLPDMILFVIENEEDFDKGYYYILQLKRLSERKGIPFKIVPSVNMRARTFLNDHYLYDDFEKRESESQSHSRRVLLASKRGTNPNLNASEEEEKYDEMEVVQKTSIKLLKPILELLSAQNLLLKTPNAVSEDQV